MPSCAQSQDQILEELAGTLAPESQAQLHAHLATCEACRREERALKDTLAWLSPAPVPPEALSGLERSTYLGWRRREDRRAGRQRWFTGLAAAAAAAVIVIVPAAWKRSAAVKAAPAAITQGTEADDDALFDAPEDGDAEADLADGALIDPEGVQP